jgi:hypothetical protein
MKAIVWAAAAVGVTLAGVAVAGEMERHEVVVAVVDESGDGETRVSLNSEDLGFNLHDLQVGESRSVVDEAGTPVLVTRTEDGFTFDVNGKTIEMPAFDGEHHGAVFVGGEHEQDVDVHVMKHPGPWSGAGPGGTMIISGKAIDEATQQQIRMLLESTGHEGEVRFIDRESGNGGPHKIKIVEKRIEKTQ